jgi:hypothetical protein
LQTFASNDLKKVFAMKTNVFTPRRLALALVAAGAIGVGGLGALSYSHNS